MKSAVSLLLLFVSIQIVFAEPTRPWEIPYQIEGLWIMQDPESKTDIGSVIITVRNDTLSAVVREIFNLKHGETPLCTLCTDTLKNRPLTGMKILWGFIQHDRTWKKGRMLDIQDGKIYRADITLSPDESEIQLFSYVRRLVKIGRTQKWTKVQTEEKR